MPKKPLEANPCERQKSRSHSGQTHVMQNLYLDRSYVHL